MCDEEQHAQTGWPFDASIDGVFRCIPLQGGEPSGNCAFGHRARDQVQDRCGRGLVIAGRVHGARQFARGEQLLCDPGLCPCGCTSSARRNGAVLADRTHGHDAR